MKIGFLDRLRRGWSYVTKRRHRSQTTQYAKAANEMAGRNLTHALRPRTKNEETELIATCLEAGFPLSDDQVPDRLREAVKRIERGEKAEK